MESGHCKCMAGLGEVCSHIGAILFYVEAVQRMNPATCTQTSCAWNVPPAVTQIPYARVKDLCFTKPKASFKCTTLS